MSIKQIVYSSRAVQAFNEPDLAALLKRARAHNLRHDITGVLLHAAGQFVQCIEGPSAAIDDLYDRIKADPRHAEVFILQQMPLPKACFKQWSMGCASVSRSEFSRLSSAAWERVASDVSDSSWQSPGFVLMRSLWQSYSEAGSAGS